MISLRFYYFLFIDYLHALRRPIWKVTLSSYNQENGKQCFKQREFDTGKAKSKREKLRKTQRLVTVGNSCWF